MHTNDFRPVGGCGKSQRLSEVRFLSDLPRNAMGKVLKREYGFSHFPALVFVRGGDYVGTICRIQDWADYLEQISAFLVAAPRRAPGFKIPVVAEGNA